MNQFNKYFDHTLLKADATPMDILRLVTEAVQMDVAAVCVNGSHVRSARRFIDAAGSNVKVAAVAGFPLGAMSTNAKAYEVQLALDDGADEIDLVMNVGQAKAGNWAYIEDEIYAIAELCHDDGAILKVIIETCLLTDDEKVRACELSENAGAAFVKTSTGFSTGGANVHDVALMKKTVGKRLQVKASGGIHTPQQAQELIAAGADRIGASNGIALLG